MVESTSGTTTSPFPLGRRRTGWVARLLVLPPLLLLAVFASEMDGLAALSVIPVWFWVLSGLFLEILTVNYAASWSWRLGLAGWLLLAACHMEEPRALVRGWFPREAADSAEGTLRIVSINCAVGEPLIIEDLVSLAPDLVLIQESPGRTILDDWAKTLYGDQGAVVWGVDCSIIARGLLQELGQRMDDPCSSAIWAPWPGRELRVLSLRLSPQPVRLDYWTPDCWRRYAATRREHRAQMGQVMNSLRVAGTAIPAIVGGDFNSPALDPAITVLEEADLHDAFLSAGRGWGATINNRFPFHRIDAIWLSESLRARSVSAVKIAHSDHRAVLCDVVVPVE